MSLTGDFWLDTLKSARIFSVMNLFSSFLCSVLYQRINSTLTCYIVFGCILDESFKSWRIVLHIKKSSYSVPEPYRKHQTLY